MILIAINHSSVYNFLWLIYELRKSWHTVKETMIKNCFAKAWFNKTLSVEYSEEQDELSLCDIKEKCWKLKEYGTISKDANFKRI